MARVALVLGAGGTVGHAYHAGVLAALASELGWDARRADLVVGTSAGSIVAALLRAGMPPGDLTARGGGRALSPDGAAVARRAGFGPPGGRPERRRRPTGPVASPARLRRAARPPWAVSTAALGSLAAAILPAGRVPTDDLAEPFDNLYGTAWPTLATWLVAVQLDTGRRTAFGGPGAPRANVSEAVRASCAVPAYFEPAVIGGERYVDGGVHSTTNADLVAAAAPRPDVVIVSAPMSAVRGATRPGPATAMRQIARLSLAREAAGLRARGIPLVAFQPGVADLEVMAGDSLDPAKFAPVAARAAETAARRLARADVRARLAALA